MEIINKYFGHSKTVKKRFFYQKAGSDQNLISTRLVLIVRKRIMGYHLTITESFQDV